MSRTTMSVIVPLSDCRGEALESIAAWVAQTCEPDRYEILVVSDGSYPGLEGTLENRLRSRDRFVRSDAGNLFGLCNAGAAAAKEPYLLFTEAHCIPEPGCMEACLDAAGDPNFVGGSCDSVGQCENYLAVLERQVLETDAAARKQPDHWRKVFIHGFFIDAQVFRDVGGFEDRFGQFSEWLLAATLHDRGYRLTHAPGAVLRHRYAGDFETVELLIESFTNGELGVRSTYPDAFCERYFGPADEWESWTRGRRPWLVPLRWKLAWRSLAVRRTRAQVRLRRHNEQACARAYRAYWSRAVQYFRLKYIARHLAATGMPTS